MENDAARYDLEFIPRPIRYVYQSFHFARCDRGLLRQTGDMTNPYQRVVWLRSNKWVPKRIQRSPISESSLASLSHVIRHSESEQWKIQTFFPFFLGNATQRRLHRNCNLTSFSRCGLPEMRVSGGTMTETVDPMEREPFSSSPMIVD